VSAYEEAWDAFRGVVSDVELDRLLKGVEREHAHELAEKIRSAPFKEHLLQRHQRERAARLIDPEVLNSGS
jgi:hypothetical protein